jgi:hypothetical protein
LGDVREQLGAERARRYQAENERDQLRKELEGLEEIQPRRMPLWLLSLLVAILIATAVVVLSVTNVVF